MYLVSIANSSDVDPYQLDADQPREKYGPD